MNIKPVAGMRVIFGHCYPILENGKPVIVPLSDANKQAVRERTAMLMRLVGSKTQS
jgi:hypothetical protein